ncbi:hypothetical protein ACFPOE_17950 [Caenimonas terrae]|uniref:Uncharacterized protein n=1 Tax=Caenimonas terrae TaxID=696074 RepID=A0ABW0NKG8_9BURK
MGKIDEWNPVYPNEGVPAQRPAGAHAPALATTAALVDSIYRTVMKLQPRAVHFYLGEGLRWIRVGFNGQGPLAPQAVAEVGGAIASCLPRSQPLFFHALRPHDLLFFLEGGESESIGMPAEYFGTPLQDVLAAWKLAPAPPKRAQRSAHSMAAAPNSQRARSSR